MDALTVQVEAAGGNTDAWAASVVATLKMKGRIEQVLPGSLPNDGIVIDDQRDYES